MANDVNLSVGFQVASRELTEIKRQVESTLQNISVDLGVELPKNLSRQLGKLTPSLASASSQQRSAVGESVLKQLNDAADKVAKSLDDVDRRLKRTEQIRDNNLRNFKSTQDKSSTSAKTFQERVDKASSSIETLTRQRQNLVKAQTELRSVTDQTSKALRDFDIRINQAVATAAALRGSQTAISAQTIDVSAVNTAVSAFAQIISQTTHSVGELGRSLNAGITQINQALSGLKDGVGTQSIESLKTSIGDISAQAKSLTEALSRFISNVGTVNIDFKAAEQRIIQTVKSVDTSIASLKNVVDGSQTLSREMSESAKLVGVANTQIESIIAALASSVEGIRRISSIDETVSNTAAALNASLRALIKSLEGIPPQIVNVGGNIGNALAGFDSISEGITLEINTIQGLVRQTGQLIGGINQNRDAIGKVTASFGQIGERLGGVTGRIEAFIGAINAAITNLSSFGAGGPPDDDGPDAPSGGDGEDFRGLIASVRQTSAALDTLRDSVSNTSKTFVQVLNNNATEFGDRIVKIANSIGTSLREPFDRISTNAGRLATSLEGIQNSLNLASQKIAEFNNSIPRVDRDLFNSILSLGEPAKNTAKTIRSFNKALQPVVKQLGALSSAISNAISRGTEAASSGGDSPKAFSGLTAALQNLTREVNLVSESLRIRIESSLDSFSKSLSSAASAVLTSFNTAATQIDTFLKNQSVDGSVTKSFDFLSRSISAAFKKVADESDFFAQRLARITATLEGFEKGISQSQGAIITSFSRTASILYEFEKATSGIAGSVTTNFAEITSTIETRLSEATVDFLTTAETIQDFTSRFGRSLNILSRRIRNVASNTSNFNFSPDKINENLNKLTGEVDSLRKRIFGLSTRVLNTSEVIAGFKKIISSVSKSLLNIGRDGGPLSKFALALNSARSNEIKDFREELGKANRRLTSFATKVDRGESVLDSLVQQLKPVSGLIKSFGTTVGKITTRADKLRASFGELNGAVRNLIRAIGSGNIPAGGASPRARNNREDGSNQQQRGGTGRVNVGSLILPPQTRLITPPGIIEDEIAGALPGLTFGGNLPGRRAGFAGGALPPIGGPDLPALNGVVGDIVANGRIFSGALRGISHLVEDVILQQFRNRGGQALEDVAERPIQGSRLGFRRFATSEEQEAAKDALDLQRSAARQAARLAPRDRGRFLREQEPSSDPLLDRAQERSFKQQAGESERERRDFSKQARTAALQAAREFAREQIAAGRTLKETTNTFDRSAKDILRLSPAFNRLAKEAGGVEGALKETESFLREGRGAIRQLFSGSVNRAFIAEQAKLVSEQTRLVNGVRQNVATFANLDAAADAFARDIESRRGVTGQANTNARNQFRDRLAKEIERRTVEEIRFNRQAAADRDSNDSQNEKAASQQARLIAENAVSAIKGGASVEKAYSDAVVSVRKLASAHNLNADRFNRVFESFANDFNKGSEKIINGRRELEERLARAREKVIREETNLANAIRRSVLQSGGRGDISSRGSRNFAQNFGGGIGPNITPNLRDSRFERLTNRLDSRDQAGVTRDVLSNASFGGGGGAGGPGGPLGPLNNSLRNASPLAQRLAENLKIGERAAFEFGVSAAQAGSRLAAWAAPSLIVFQAIGRIREAANTIIELDTQLRRLTFFQNDESNPFLTFERATGRILSSNEKLAQNFRFVTEEARRTGLSIQQVTDAVLTISRIGRAAFEVNNAGVLDPSTYLRAVEGLVRLEGGALDAGRATELLESILQQNNLTTQDSIAVAAALADQTSRTSFDVERLGTVAAGVGAAFKNLQNINVFEQFAIAAVAARRLGTNASRTRTALRQLSTLFVRFGSEIQEATGVEVVDDSGRLRSVDAIFEVLEEIDKLKGTRGAFQLTDLISEAENIPDFQNLSSAASEFRKELERVGNITFVEDSITRFSEQEVTQIDSLRSSIERLNTEIVTFTENIGIESVISSFTGGLADLLKVGQSVAKLLGEFPSLLQGLVGLATIPLVKGATRFGAGLFGQLKGRNLSTVQNQIRESALSDNARFRGGEIATTVQQEGFISEQRAEGFRKESNRLLGQQLRTTSRIALVQEEINRLERSTFATEEQKNRAKQRLNRLQSLEQGILNKELNLRRQITAEVVKQENIQRRNRSGRLGQLGTALAVAGFAFGDNIANAITKNDKAQKQISGFITGAIEGAFIGGTAGSFIAPGIGTAIGAVGGALVGGGVAAFSAGESADEESLEAAKQRAELQRRINQGTETARRLVIDQARLSLQSSAELTELEESLIKLKEKAQIAQINLVDAQQKGLNTIDLERKVREANLQLQSAQLKLQRQESAAAEERILQERELTAIRERASRLQSAIQLVGESRIFEAERSGAKDFETRRIRFDVDRQSLQAEAVTIQQELNRVRQRIAAQEGVKGNEQERRSLEGQAIKLEEQLSGIRLKSLEQEFQARRDILKLATDEQNKQVETWRTAAKEMAASLGRVISDQRDIVSFVQRVGDIDLNIRDARLELSRIISEFVGQDITSKISGAQAQLQGITGRRREQIGVNAGFERREVRAQGIFISQIDTIAKELRASLKGPTRDSDLTIEQRLRREEARLSVEAAKERFNANRIQFDIEQRRQQALEKSIRDEISARQELIKSNKELIEAQAQRGELLLNDPQEFLKQLGQIQNAQRVFGNRDFSEPGSFAQIRAIVDQISGQQGGFVALREIQAGLQAAVSQGLTIAQGITSEDLLRRFQAAIIGGTDTGQAGQAIDNELEAIRKANEQLIETLSRQQGLEQAQADFARAFARITEIEAEFIRRTGTDERDALNQINAVLPKLEAEFDEVNGTVQRLGLSVTNLLESTEFNSGIKLVNSSVQQIIEILSVGSSPGQDIAEQIKRRELASRASLERLLGDFGGAEFSRLADLLESAGNKEVIDFFVKNTEQTANRLSSDLSKLTSDNRKALIDNVSKADSLEDTNRILPIISNAVLDAIRTSQESGGNVPDVDFTKILRSSLLESVNSSNAESRIDEDTAKRIFDVATSGALGGLLRNLDKELDFQKKFPENALVGERINELRNQIDQVVRGLSTKVASDEVLNALMAEIELFRQQREQELKNRSNRLDAVGVSTEDLVKLISRELDTRSTIGGGSEERQDFVRGIQEASKNGVAEAFSSAIDRLEAALADGLTVNAGEINLKIEQEVRTRLESSDELQAIVNRLAGGNEDEIRRINRLLEELIRLELDRGSALSAGAF